MSKTKEKILQYLANKGQITISELVDHLALSKQVIHRHMKRFLEDGKIVKIGTPPKVFYELSKEEIKPQEEIKITPDLLNIIENSFLNITPDGRFIKGLKGFMEWCGERKLFPEKTAEKYFEIQNKYNLYKKDGYIDGMYKLEKTFSEVFLDKVFYLDFYAVEIFGKTKLGQMLLYAKQSQDKKLIKSLIEEIKPQILNLLILEKVEAVGFIPPTVKRGVQFMKVLEKELNLKLPIVFIDKIRTEIIIPQKTLGKLEDRIKNAEQTIVVRDQRFFRKILLIDDALGSGATLNEVAKKIKKQKLAEIVVGLAITGSFSGFEVISEV